MPNTRLENIILENPGIGARQISKLSGVGISQVMKVKRRLKRISPSRFGIEKRYPVNEDSLSEVSEHVLGGMTGKEKKGFIQAIVGKLLNEGRISYEEVEELGFNDRKKE